MFDGVNFSCGSRVRLPINRTLLKLAMVWPFRVWRRLPSQFHGRWPGGGENCSPQSSRPGRGFRRGQPGFYPNRALTDSGDSLKSRPLILLFDRHGGISALFTPRTAVATAIRAHRTVEVRTIPRCTLFARLD